MFGKKELEDLKGWGFNMTVIQVKNLTKKYEYYKKEPGIKGSIKALINRKNLYADAVKDISFSINEGELVGFLGPNGAGKTTTLKMLSGILYPSSGEVKVLGYLPYKREKEYLKKFSLVMGQKNQLIADLPAWENFILIKEIYGVSDSYFKKKSNELIDLLGVRDVINVNVRKLSLGQRMKCELIAALLHNPKVLFLDEPTIGLDVVAQKNIRDFIKKYNKEKKTTIVLTSHYMEDIRQLCERVIVINLGKIVYDGSLNELIKKYAPHKVLKLVFSTEKVSRKKLLEYGEIASLEPYNCELKVKRESARDIAGKILASDLPVEDINILEEDVDQVIREIFGTTNSI